MYELCDVDNYGRSQSIYFCHDLLLIQIENQVLHAVKNKLCFLVFTFEIYFIHFRKKCDRSIIICDPLHSHPSTNAAG
jgi:hypothetical protein